MTSKVVFLHPDLGVGGAERLVVDAAISLKQGGHDVSFVTSHHNRDHCFSETKDGTFTITVVGDWLPRHIFGKCYALCAYIRMIYCSLYIIFNLNPDIVFCDLVSVCIPVLHFSVKKVIFYCHFPDLLLSKKGNILKNLYRAPLNWLEEVTTSCADKIFVNSNFTKAIFKKTFKNIVASPDILYPSINTISFDSVDEFSLDLDFLQPPLPKDSFIFLSLNRYERKKNVELSIFSLSKLKNMIPPDTWKKITLIIAGGYDQRVAENVEYYCELTKIAREMDVLDKIYFLKSPSDVQKVTLLKISNCVIYTPPFEHFGIVPLEAMYCAKPVIAVNSGGPTETILDNETGFLCDGNEEDFSRAMTKLIQDRTLCKQMGEAGHQRFCKKFSFQAFSSNLNSSVVTLTRSTES